MHSLNFINTQYLSVFLPLFSVFQKSRSKRHNKTYNIGLIYVFSYLSLRIITILILSHKICGGSGQPANGSASIYKTLFPVVSRYFFMVKIDAIQTHGSIVYLF